MSSSPTDGLHVRRATTADAPAIAALVKAADEAVQGWSEASESELLSWWRMVDLERDSWVVHDKADVVAYGIGLGHGDAFVLDGFVHPLHQRRGLGAWLVRHAEERARERELPKLHAWSLAADARAHRSFEQFGMRELRRFYRMLIELDGPPPEPELPDGLRIETFRLEDAPAFHAALGDAFAEEWGFVQEPFERWYERRVAAPDYDPTLWFLVRDGDELAAVMRCEADRSDAGFVGALGVRKQWRKRGVGLALLHHAFGEFHRRGQPRIALGVDAENPTGATRLYERAGMHVAYEAIAYGKELT
jgi:mycothiol synthase